VIHLTDFHFGPFFSCPELESLVDQVNSIEGDILCITGDLFHSSLSPAEVVPDILQRLRTRKLGNYAVLGNHDYYAGEARSVKNIERSNLRLLRDEWITFEHGNAVVHMGGLDDPRVNWMWGEKVPNFPRFMDRAPKKDGLRIALSHRPSVLPLAAQSGIDLVLSGHTHGGQIVIPRPGGERGASIAGLFSPYTLGWYRVGQCSMYLNRGVGMTFLPWRINCPPEIAVIHIKSVNETKAACFPIDDYETARA
jgi:predicted MPP superfamily phosphohydrolase